MSRPRARAAAGPTAGSADASGSTIALELVPGLAFGVLLPLGVDGLVRFRLLGAEPKPQPLLPLATGTVPYATCHLQSGIPQDEEAFTLVAVCVVFSIMTGIPDGPNRGHTGSKAPQPLGGTGET
ncbi:hypothetical protein [Streptomyces mirabilis]|uniref:hypothetical protein n=1 Tax=Streptomyces mirabilis TaxID=68239 RepID=UPI00332026D2